MTSRHHHHCHKISRKETGKKRDISTKVIPISGPTSKLKILEIQTTNTLLDSVRFPRRRISSKSSLTLVACVVFFAKGGSPSSLSPQVSVAWLLEFSSWFSGARIWVRRGQVTPKARSGHGFSSSFRGLSDFC